MCTILKMFVSKSKLFASYYTESVANKDYNEDDANLVIFEAKEQTIMANIFNARVFTAVSRVESLVLWKVRKLETMRMIDGVSLNPLHVMLRN